jgi:predicted negative regulator of RcsB-dependent stress response
MDRYTRKELKTDKFAQGVETGWEFLAEHRGQTARWGAIALAVVVIAAGIWLYRSHQATQRTELLAKAMQVDDATVGTTPQPPRLNFATAEEKEKARIAAFMDVAVKYPGSQEAAIAQLAVAAAQADKGQVDEALKTFQKIVDTAPDPYNSVAKLSLAQIYESQGKTDEAEKLLRQLVDKPTIFVSKEQATLDLGQLLAKKNPAEARKLLEPLSQSKRTVVSRAAVAAMSSIPASPAPPQSN